MVSHLEPVWAWRFDIWISYFDSSRNTQKLRGLLSPEDHGSVTGGSRIEFSQNVWMGKPAVLSAILVWEEFKSNHFVRMDAIWHGMEFWELGRVLRILP